MPDRLIRISRALCAVFDPRYRCHQGQQASAAHNPALLIRICGQPRASKPVPALGLRRWMDREFPDKSQARARQALAALEQRMRDAGLELHPDKTRVIYCRDSARRQPWGGPVSFDFLGYAFRPRDTMGKNGRFTGFDLAASPKAIKRMSKIVKGWRLHRHTDLTWEQLAGWIGPVIRGWMAHYGRFCHSELHQLLARINYHVQEWIRAKYRRLRPLKVMKRAWNQISAQTPGLLPHWRWETGAWY